MAMIYACEKDTKGQNRSENASALVELRSDTLECRPDLGPGCVTDTIINDTIPTFLGCDAIASYYVTACYNNSNPGQATSITVWGVDLEFSSNCGTLVDTIIYFVTHNNQSQAAFFLRRFNQLATQNIEAKVLATYLDDPELYQCDKNSFVDLEFFSTKCYNFCVDLKNQVPCGFGCCKRATGYCFDGNDLKVSYTNISPASPCIPAPNICELGTVCLGSCEILEPVVLDDK